MHSKREIGFTNCDETKKCSSWADPEGEWVTGVLNPSGKLQVAIYDSLEILVRALLEKQLGPIASRGRSVRPCVKYIEN